MPRRTEPEPYAAKIGARIQELRTERSMTLAELGEVSGLSKGRIPAGQGSASGRRQAPPSPVASARSVAAL